MLLSRFQIKRIQEKIEKLIATGSAIRLRSEDTYDMTGVIAETSPIVEFSESSPQPVFLISNKVQRK